MQSAFNIISLRVSFARILLLFLTVILLPNWIICQSITDVRNNRERISINDGWLFMKYITEPDKLIYDERPVVSNRNDNVVADTKATDTSSAGSADKGLKKWILPVANDFINDVTKHHERPTGNPGSDFPFVQNNFNDNAWRSWKSCFICIKRT